MRRKIGACTVVLAFVLAGCRGSLKDLDTDQPTSEEQKVESEEQEVEHEIIVLRIILDQYATRALERPKNLAECVREMMAMGRSGECADRFTHYQPPDEAKIGNEDLTGSFTGIGAELTLQDNIVTIVAPLPDSPAEKAGLKPKDRILKVDGKETAGLNKTVNMIRGPEGTTVTLTVWREGTSKPFEVKVVRKKRIHVSVTSRLAPGNTKVGVVKVTGFAGNTPVMFAEHLITLRKQGVEYFIIDLRNNPGGLVPSTIEMLSLFAKPKDTILTTRYKEREEVASEVEVDVPEELRPLDLPHAQSRVVVLVNGGSASASEIFAGTMKDWGYKIVGEKSFGKGVGQHVIQLPDGGNLVLTTFEFLVGNSKTAIRDKGVTPSVEVKEDDDPKTDLQLERALKLLVAGQ